METKTTRTCAAKNKKTVMTSYVAEVSVDKLNDRLPKNDSQQDIEHKNILFTK